MFFSQLLEFRVPCSRLFANFRDRHRHKPPDWGGGSTCAEPNIRSQPPTRALQHSSSSMCAKATAHPPAGSDSNSAGVPLARNPAANKMPARLCSIRAPPETRAALPREIASSRAVSINRRPIPRRRHAAPTARFEYFRLTGHLPRSHRSRQLSVLHVHPDPRARRLAVARYPERSSAPLPRHAANSWPRRLSPTAASLRIIRPATSLPHPTAAHSWPPKLARPPPRPRRLARQPQPSDERRQFARTPPPAVAPANCERRQPGLHCLRRRSHKQRHSRRPTARATH